MLEREIAQEIDFDIEIVSQAKTGSFKKEIHRREINQGGRDLGDELNWREKFSVGFYLI